jgi:hypothetical protein
MSPTFIPLSRNRIAMRRASGTSDRGMRFSPVLLIQQAYLAGLAIDVDAGNAIY